MVRSARGDLKDALEEFCYNRMQGSSESIKDIFLDKRYFSNFDADEKDSKGEKFDNTGDRC